MLESGEKLVWSKIWSITTKKASNIIEIRYSFNEEEPKLMDVQKKKRVRRRMSATPELEDDTPRFCEIPPKYHEALPISAAKKKDLLALCSASIIPQRYHDFYKNLKEIQSNDRLPEPDCEEDDNDTDVE